MILNKFWLMSRNPNLKHKVCKIYHSCEKGNLTSPWASFFTPPSQQDSEWTAWLGRPVKKWGIGCVNLLTHCRKRYLCNLYQIILTSNEVESAKQASNIALCSEGEGERGSLSTKTIPVFLPLFISLALNFWLKGKFATAGGWMHARTILAPFHIHANLILLI